MVFLDFVMYDILKCKWICCFQRSIFKDHSEMRFIVSAYLQGGGKLFIHKTIEKQAINNPNRTAIIAGNESLSYSQLNNKANKVAAYLLSKGMQCNSIVGIYMNRSVNVAVGILGILKAGCAYLPIDPQYPQERIVFMIEDANIPIILTCKSSSELNMDKVSSKVLIIDIDSELLNDNDNTFCKNQMSDLACVMYTSGTTGKPKGVMTTHKNISSYVESLSNRLQFIDSDIYMHTASIAFSSSNRQLLLPLANGLTVIMALKKEPLYLFETIKMHDVSIIDLVPNHMKSCLEFLKAIGEIKRQDLLSNKLRVILSASEALSTKVPDLWKLFSNRNIKYINMYGITETTGIILTYEIPNSHNNTFLIEPIGFPLNNVEIYLLNDNMEPIHDNSEGNLYIEGPQVTNGYMNNPKLTNQLFIKNPLLPQNNTVLFKTGDICRYNVDGYIEYVGRYDHQIKINGMRIEPREIELKLSQYDGIKDVVVVAKEINDQKALLAYVVIENNNNLGVSHIQSFARSVLPMHMVPTHYMQIESIPITPNGKIDQLSLPDFKSEKRANNLKTKKSCNELESWLQSVWEEILSNENIDIDDGFFTLGGNSLLAFSIITRIYNRFNINLDTSELFNNSTIRTLAKYIDEKNSIISDNRKRGEIL
jgi:amino acid adenylation domain-containing protein